MRFRRNRHDSDSEDEKVGSEYGREALILHEAVRVMRYSTCTSCIGRYLRYTRGEIRRWGMKEDLVYSTVVAIFAFSTCA